MESKHYECVFLADKLGMLYSVHEGKVIVIGLDSNQYKQTASSGLTTSSLPKEATADKVEEEETSKYDGVITLDPTRASQVQNEASDGREPTKKEDSAATDAGCTQEAPSKLKLSESASTMTATEVLSALANFEEEPSEGDAQPSDEQSAFVSSIGETEGATATSTAEAAEDASPSSSHYSIMKGHASKTVGESMIASDSYEDFQSTLRASLSANSVSGKYSAGFSSSAKASPHDTHALLLPDEEDTAVRDTEEREGTPEMESPFGQHMGYLGSSLDASQHGESAAGTVSDTPITAATPTLEEETGVREPLTLTRDALFLQTSQVISAPLTPLSPAPAIDPHGQGDHSVHMNPTAVRKHLQRVARLFGVSPAQLQALAAQWQASHARAGAEAVDPCSGAAWSVRPAAADAFMGTVIEYVNGVQIRDLDGAFQLALIKQRNRPLTLKFRTKTDVLAPSSSSDRLAEGRYSPLLGQKTAAPLAEKFKYSLFMAKYTSTAAARIRSTVDSTLQDYVTCDWADAKAKGEGLPQVTVVSIYKYIECEMTKLELFNHYHAKGYGVPAVMQESHWDDIRGHIESLVYRAIGSFTRTLWPIFAADNGFDFVDTEDSVSDLKANTFIGVDLSVGTVEAQDNEEDEPEQTSRRRTFSQESGRPSEARGGTTEPSIELSKDHPLRMKLAFLRFVTLESTGLDTGSKPKHAADAPEEDSPAGGADSRAQTIAVVHRMREMNRAMLRHREEWYLAMRGLCRSLQLETPGDVLQALANTVKLISHALDAYLNNYPEEKSGPDKQSCPQCGAQSASCLPCSCGAVHLIDESHYVHHIAPTQSAASTSTTEEHTQCERNVLTELLVGQKVLQRADEAELASSGLKSSKPAAPREHRILSADDLMPAITYVLIQANPPNIEYVLWMCAEFRNPALLRGEEAFCLAQLSSAMEFCKHADYRGFDIPHAVYNACMLSYTATLKLLVACKTGDLPQVQDLVRNHNADINGLSPDHKDSPLTACIRFGRHEILRYLLSLPGIDVNAPVQLFHGPNQRTSPLLLAVRYNQLEMVVDLLVAGADRNYCDDSGVFAFSIAAENTLPQLQMVLQADPCEYDLVDMIIAHDQLCAIGLLLQKVEVNYLHESAQLVSPLIAAVQKRDICLIRFLLNRQLCRTEVNLSNARGETALIVCALEFAQSPCQELIDIAAMLLRFGADRYQTDHSGKCALDYVKTAREAYKAQERNALNPFGPDKLASTGSAQDTTYRVNPYQAEREEDMPPTPTAPPVPSSSAAYVSAPTKKRPSALSVPPPPPPPPPPPAAPAPSTASPPPVPQAPAPTAAPPVPSAPPAASVSAETKRLLKDMALLLANDPLKASIPPIYELSRDRRLLDVRSLLYQGVDVNAICEEKGYSALIAAVYNTDLPMLKLLLQADEICRKTYFSTQFSIISAVNSALKGTPEIVEADLHINEDGVAEGETDGYLRTVDNTEKEYLIAPHTPHLVRALSDSTISEQRARSLKFAGKSNVVDIDGAGRNGMRALHYASQIGDIGIVGALLQSGANREVFNNKLHTPLDVCLANNHIAAANAIRFDPEKVSICLAAKHGDWTVMTALLCQGVSINTQRNHMGKNSDALQHELYTPLLAAVAYGQTEIVKQILDVPGVDVNLANPLNQTALMFAAARGDEGVVLLLLSRGADRWVLDSQGYIALAWAESRKRESLACILRHDPARVWVHDVIRNNDFAAVIGMLKQGVDINLRRYTKLVPHSPAASVAVGKIDAVGSQGNAHSTPERRNKSVDSGRGGRSPMFADTPEAAAEAQDNNLGGGGEFVMGETPLIVAARYGRLDVIAILLKAPAPGAVQLNLADNAGNTALHHAAAKGQEEAVLLLVKAHASRHARNLLGITPGLVAKSAGFPLIGAIIEADPYLVHIHDMCEQGDVRMVIALLKQGCPLNYQDERAGKRMQTPLMAAATGGQADVVRMLLRNDEVLNNIDIQDTQGRTALMRAAAVGALNVTAVLLNAGCNRALKDNEGMTARDHASKHSYTVMFQFISQSMVR